MNSNQPPPSRRRLGVAALAIAVVATATASVVAARADNDPRDPTAEKAGTSAITHDVVALMPAGWPATEAMRRAIDHRGASAAPDDLDDVVALMPAGWPATEAMRRAGGATSDAATIAVVAARASSPAPSALIDGDASAGGTMAAAVMSSPGVVPLTSFDGRGSGSTIGPDGALYATDSDAGRVLRIDRRTGHVTTYAAGLPPRRVRNGGAMDVAFVGARAYVLVTLVGSDLGGDDTVGIYRIERDGTHTVLADIGAWSMANPPDTAFFVPTGVQYAIQPYRRGFLVTDGHHNRVLHVDRHGAISEFATFGNDVPTGLESGRARVHVAEAGPVPHLPETGKVVAVQPRSGAIVELASGARLLVDVERGPGGKLYALSQGEWDGIAEGSPAIPDTGRLVVVGRDGSLTPVVDRTGAELVLDRPTSMEFVAGKAYVVSIVGDVVRIDNL
jgi:hypothetical protein